MRSLFTAAPALSTAPNVRVRYRQIAFMGIQAIKLHAQNKCTILIDEIATGDKHSKAGATAAFAGKVKNHHRGISCNSNNSLNRAMASLVTACRPDIFWV